MDVSREFVDQNINITIPVIIDYIVLDKYLKQKLVGEIISKGDSETGKSNYAQILDVSISKSDKEDFDLCLDINLQTLTSLFKNKQIKVLFHAALYLDREKQHISLKDFEVDGKTNNWLTDQLLEKLINNWMYTKLKKKMNFDLLPHLEEKIASLNEKLEDKLEAKEGVHLIGSLDNLEISNLMAGEKELWISVSVTGTGLVQLEKLEL
ncbi:hypothetical protein GCM10023115_37500 [Pontixanthobacter gangjinensis]|uniref:DUF4403 family protein n=1 Tax=Christiangramia aestuarii TaxID=1028746 RepID=A0A7K1LQM3_9FLAO|nr:DUF4403 family protein [Christiangramia aestuarii]MUP43083.1 DUF4403 family protein [Christiangramia aestuarii]